MKRTKLCLKDIYELVELWILKILGAIGLSFIDVLFEIYVQNLKRKATAEALTFRPGSKNV